MYVPPTISYITITITIIGVIFGVTSSTLAQTEAYHADDGGHDPTTAEVPRPIYAYRKQQQQRGFSSRTLKEDIELDEAIIERQPRSQRPTLMDIALQASAREGLNAIAEFYGKTLPGIVRNGQLLEDNHPAALLSKFSAPADDSERREMAGFATVLATKAFRKNYKHINELARHAHTPKISLRRTALEGLCPPRDPPKCMPASERYRTHDGTCNNKKRPRWGGSQMPFNRFLPPEYGDGVDTIRNSVEGGALSSSRFVSLLVHGARDGEAPLTLMTVQWGQLLDHDLTSTAQPRPINGSVPSCCGSKDFHPSCYPIKVPLDDPWLAPLKVRCLEFLRSAPAQRRDCVLSWREQTNQVTSYIDASPIYSNSAKSSDNARVFRNGLLIYGRGPPADDVCQRGAIEAKCIRAGDGRSSEQPGLLALHHVWVGEHNRIAMEISEMNLHWSDEKIYQETRRIIGAMFQHITYREFLPIILGREVCKLFDLELANSGYYEGYDMKVNPTVANSFAAAAFRFGHSLVQNSYIRLDRHHNVINNNVSLHEEFQRGDIGSAGSLHRLLRGLATQRALKRDEFITPELTNHLFQTPGFPFGLDLAAINIQRGRDHGVAPYTSWRIPCGLTAINTWEDLVNVVGPESARRIGHAYRSVHDIDLFVGGIAERPVVGGLVGPTFACIIAQQFSNSRKGDRFWYENGGFESSFTPAQLHSIRRVSLAQVLCRAVGGGTFQPHIFIPPGFPGNERLPCGAGTLEPIDLSPWLEQDPFGAPPAPSATFSTQRPDRIFDILPTTNLNANTMSALQVIKENKAGFPHRNNTSSIQHVNFIPNSSNGIQRPQNLHPKNSTKINDKLDIKIKGGGTTPKKPVRTVITGINNKLDKGNKRITLNIRGVNRKRIPNSTRRTVVVNNIPIELRSATAIDDSKDTKTTTDNVTKPKNTRTRTTTQTTNEPHTDTNTESEKPEARMADDDETTNELDETATTHILDDYTDVTTVAEENVFDIFFPSTEPTVSPLISTVASVQNHTNPDGTRKANTIEKDILVTTETVLPKASERATETPFRELNDTDDRDIDPLAHSPTDEHKRVQRKLDELNLTEDERSRLTKTITKRRPLATTNTTTTTSFIRNKAVNVTLAPILYTLKNRTVTPTKAHKSTKTAQTTPQPTKRSVELRQYQTPALYTRPHKVIVDGPNSDQYEIEINIRQTNKSPPSKPIGNYAEYTTVNSVPPYREPYYGYDRYPTKPDYTTTTHTGYYQAAPPTLAPTYAQTHRTKPPTIIYLNEHNEHTTTRQPGFLQNFFTFATNGLSGNQRPHPSTLTEQERPSYELSNPHSSNAALSGSPHYIPRPQSQSKPPHPISSSSFSQVDAHLGGGGVAHVTSTAISSGHYGSIVGVANANGADSTFSFNIRPKPETAGGYGLIPPHRPQYIGLPAATPQGAHYYEQYPYRETANSPFSSGNKKPLTQTYYGRTQIGPHKKVGLTELQDYEDYLSRTLEPLTNITETTELDDKDEYDDYDEGLEQDLNYDKDGNLRPEHILANLFKTKDNPIKNNTCHKRTLLDDNYVLPVLNGSKGNIPLQTTDKIELLDTTETLTNFPDALSKHLSRDIEAEDNDFVRDGASKSFAMQRSGVIETTGGEIKRRHTPSIKRIAFAPIRILTQPERPDNWIIFESPKEQHLLPQQPEISADSVPSAEIPKPIKDSTNIGLLKGIGEQDTANTDSAVTDAAAGLQNDTELHVEPRLQDITDLTSDSRDSAKDNDEDRKQHEAKWAVSVSTTDPSEMS